MEKTSSIWRKLLPWLIATVCLAAVARIIITNRREMELILERVEPDLILSALVLSVLNIMLFSVRIWHVMRECGNLPIPQLFWHRVFLLSQLLNFVVPQSGSVYRAMQLKKEVGLRYTAYVGGYFTFAWLSFLFLLVGAAFVLGLWGSAERYLDLPVAFWLVLAAVAVLLVPLVAARLCRLDMANLKWPSWIAERLRLVFVMSLACLQSLWFFTAFLLLSFFSVLAGVLVLYVVSHGIGLEPSIVGLVILFVVIQLSAYVLITPGNIGVQELLYGLVGTQIGFSLAGGVMMALFVRVFHLGALVLLALLLVAVSSAVNRQKTGEVSGSEPR